MVISFLLSYPPNVRGNANFREATSVIDKLVMKGLIHKNKAARHKSRLNKQIRKLG